MDEQRVLEEAIAALRKHRHVLGNSVVETAVSALQAQLSVSDTGPLIEQFESVVILQADLSGFTAMSAAMDAERVRDMVNALWTRLDYVVLTWGGQIEQHTGDGLIALFGVPVAHEDDAQRAILAALDMQLELSLFNETAAVPAEMGPTGREAASADFKMRIGIHTGPVLWGRVGQSMGQTAVGDTVRVVGRLEKAAPEGGVLISYDVYNEVFGLFEVTPRAPLPFSTGEDALPVYVVEREKPRIFHQRGYGGPGIRSGFVGRVRALSKLEFAWQETLDNSVMQVVTVVGDPGLGKTRLFDEFSRWLDMMPIQGQLLQARSFRDEMETPWATMKQLFFDFFGIHERSTPAVIREKFSRGVARYAMSHKISAQEQAHVMGHLLGIDYSDSPYVENLQGDRRRLQKYGRQDLARFFTDLAAQYLPLVLVLEDAQWADEASLALIEYLLEACYDQPILVVCLARPAFWGKRPLWHVVNEPLSPYTTLPLPPLSAIDSRHMVADLLSEIRHVPFRLSDLLVHSAQGNPLFLEQMVRCLYDTGVIQTQDEAEPQIDLSKLDNWDVPDSLADLFLARFNALSFENRRILEAAAIVGQTFWDGAVYEAVEPELDLSPAALTGALAELEQKELIYRQRSSLLMGSLAYRFGHDLLWDVVYAQVTRPARKLYHSRITGWLAARREGDR